VPFFALAAISGVLTYVVSIYKEAEIKADEDLKEPGRLKQDSPKV